MQKLVLLVILFQLRSSSISGLPRDICSTSGIVSDDNRNIPLPFRNESDRYQVMYEKLRDIGSDGKEIREIFDGLANIGVASLNAYSLQASLYAYFDQNELIVTSGDSCDVFKLDELASETPFTVVTVNGKPHIATPLTLLSQDVSTDVAYLGSVNRVRGIPVRQWLICAKSHPNEYPIKVMVSYSSSLTIDPEKWEPALKAPGYESIPVQIQVTHIDEELSDVGYVTDTYNVFDFQPGIHLREEDYHIRPGYYCKNRMTKKAFPNISETFSLIARSGNEGSKSFQDEFFYERFSEKKLAKKDYIVKKEFVTDILDLNTGVEYTISRNLGNCSVNKAGVDAFYDLFQVNFLPFYEYVGQRRVRGINTDVWIAPRRFEIEEYLYEWYFMAPEWSALNFEGNSHQHPVQASIYDPKTRERLMVIELSDFKRENIDIFGFDLSDCSNIERKHVKFNINVFLAKDKSKYEIISKNRLEFKKATWFALESSARVEILRIGKLEVILDDGIIYVMFSLLDKLSTFKPELTLEESFKELEKSFQEKKFSIVFKDQNGMVTTVTPDWKSLSVLDSYYGRYNYKTKNVVKGVSGGIVAGLVIGGLAIGLVVGLVGHALYTVIKRKNQDDSVATMMSFPNPTADPT